jgi:hypothetical protein
MMLQVMKALPVISLFLLLSACQGFAVSPQAAATNMLLEQTTTGMTVNLDMLQVRQVLKVNEGQSMVLLSFEGTRPEMGAVACLYSYQTLLRFSGWISANGGGGCHDTPPEQELQDIEVTAGHYSGEKPPDPGYTLVYGEVNNAAIVAARVTWEDRQLTEVEVVNATILVLRTGDLMIEALEGLDLNDEVIFRSAFNTRP